MRQRISEVLKMWGCSPETTEQLLLNHDDVGVYINLLDTVRDPELCAKCAENFSKLRNKAYFMLDRQERLESSVDWPTTKVLSKWRLCRVWCTSAQTWGGGAKPDSRSSAGGASPAVHSVSSERSRVPSARRTPLGDTLAIVVEVWNFTAYGSHRRHR